MTNSPTPGDNLYIPDAWLEPVCHPNSANALLRFCGLPARYLSSDNTLISLLDLHEMLSENAIAPTAELAFEFSGMMEPSYHGLVGQVVTASKTLRQAIEMFVRYKPTRNRLFHCHWNIEDDVGILFFEPRVDLGIYKQFHLVSILHTSYKILEFILGRNDAGGVGFCHSRDLAKIEIFDKSFRLDRVLIEGREGLGLAIPVSELDKQNPMADTKQFSAACRSLDEELNSLEGQLTEKVKSLIYTLKDHQSENAREYEWRSLQDVADILHLSRSTLIRKLKLEGAKFSAILDETRHHLACWYLLETQTPVAEIAYLLGYKDSSNLGRTFKKWTGQTPAKFRSAHRKSPVRQ